MDGIGGYYKVKQVRHRQYWLFICGNGKGIECRIVITRSW
jgi:hypothetical protein